MARGLLKVLPRSLSSRGWARGGRGERNLVAGRVWLQAGTREGACWR
jgi:hypothetical protein